jgi:hypothetical protein
MKGFIILDIMMIIIVLFLVGMGVFIGSKMLTAIEDQTSDINSSTYINQSYLKQGEYGLDVMNGVFIFLVVGLFIAVLIGAYMINEHPIFFIISFFLLVIMVMIGAGFSNVFESFSQTAEFSDQAGHFNIITEVMSKLPYIILIFGAIILIVMFGKGRNDQGAVA